MTEAFRPFRGGYIHAFGASWFITEFLKGNGPMGTPGIDASKGAPQADIHSAYKLALHTAIADDRALRDIEDAIKAGRPYPDEEFELRKSYYLARVPSRLTRMRYSSFCTYFSRLIQLGWVERTGEEEPSIPQENWPDARPRVFYRLTPEAMAREVPQVFDPIMLLHPDYTREKRSGKKHLYFATVPVRRLPKKAPPKPTPPPKAAPAKKPALKAAPVIPPPKKAARKPTPAPKAPPVEEMSLEEAIRVSTVPKAGPPAKAPRRATRTARAPKRPSR